MTYFWVRITSNCWSILETCPLFSQNRGKYGSKYTLQGTYNLGLPKVGWGTQRQILDSYSQEIENEAHSAGLIASSNLYEQPKIIYLKLNYKFARCVVRIKFLMGPCQMQHKIHIFLQIISDSHQHHKRHQGHL